MLDTISGTLISRLAYRLKNAGLGYATEEIVDGRPPSSGNHIELNGATELIGMMEGPWAPVPGLVHGIDRQADDMSEQARSAVAVPFLQSVPKLRRFLRECPCPIFMTRADRFSRRAVIQPWRLGAKADALQLKLKAAVRAVMIEAPQC